MWPRDDSHSADTPSLTRQPPVRHLRLVLGGLALCVVLMLGARTVISTLAAVAAPYVPAQWEATVGDDLLPYLAPPGTVCAAPPGQAALDRLAHRLLPTHRHLESRYRIIVVDRPLVNALSLPGGTIVLYQGLLERIQTPSQLAGALAHELAHLEARHVTRTLLERTAEAAILSSLSGEGYAPVLGHPASAGFASFLDRTAQLEAEADRAAVRSLLDAGFDPEAFVDLLRRLEPLEEPDRSTGHSDLASRIQGLESFVSAHRAAHVPGRLAPGLTPGLGQYRPGLSDTEWRAVQSLCRVGHRATSRADSLLR